MQDEVFIVVFRAKGSDDPWRQHFTWNSRSGRPYVKAGPAKGIANKLNKSPYYGEKYEFAARRGVVQWDEDVIV